MNINKSKYFYVYSIEGHFYRFAFFVNVCIKRSLLKKEKSKSNGKKEKLRSQNCQKPKQSYWRSENKWMMQKFAQKKSQELDHLRTIANFPDETVEYLMKN